MKQDAKKLVAYLMQVCSNDVERTRALVRWIADNIRYDVDSRTEGTRADQSVEAVLTSGSAVCAGYVNVITRMAS